MTAKAELRRERARKSLLHFTKYTFPGYRANWHHRVLCDVLQRFVEGEIPRLLVLMPPRHGKSELVSRRLPAWILGRFPNARIIATSYSADLSSRMNRDVQRIVDSPAYRELFPGTELYRANVRAIARGAYLRNSDIFEIVGHDGSYRSAGVGGGITGMGFDFGIIDDPIKNRAEANSQAYRDGVWDWYASTFYTRQEDGARILVTMTPWHPDDLAARLLALSESEPNADQWHVIRFPAIAEGELSAYDMRAEGAALWPGKYDLETLTQIQSTVGLFEWNALYQCRPRVPEGEIIKREWFEIVDAVPSGMRRVRYWDKAGTANAGAYTAGVLMGYSAKTGRYYVEDVVRGQWEAGDRERVIKQTAQLDAATYGHVRIYVEQEPGSGGKESAEATVRNLAGFAARADRVGKSDGDKMTRLDPFAAQAQAGNVFVKRGKWNAAWLEELCAVPGSRYWDQADATSGAFNKLSRPQGVGAY